MKKLLLFLTFFFIKTHSYSQIQNPVHWSYGTKKVSDGIYQVHLKAVIDEDWHLYAQQQPENAVAKPTKIVFKSSGEAYILMGKVREIGKLEKYLNASIGVCANQYTNTVDFVQLIKVTKAPPVIISGVITFQTCTNQQCLAPTDLAFLITIK